MIVVQILEKGGGEGGAGFGGVGGSKSIDGDCSQIHTCTRWTCCLYLNQKLDKGPQMNLSRVHEHAGFRL